MSASLCSGAPPRLNRPCSLDLHTDEKIRAVIRTELADCTVIAVAHRIGKPHGQSQ